MTPKQPLPSAGGSRGDSPGTAGDLPASELALGPPRARRPARRAAPGPGGMLKGGSGSGRYTSYSSPPRPPVRAAAPKRGRASAEGSRQPLQQPLGALERSPGRAPGHGGESVRGPLARSPGPPGRRPGPARDPQQRGGRLSPQPARSCLYATSPPQS